MASWKVAFLQCFCPCWSTLLWKLSLVKKKNINWKKTYLLMSEIEWFGNLCKTRLWNPSTLLFLSPIKQRFKWPSEILHIEDAPSCSWNLDMFVRQFIFQLLNKRGMALESHSCASLLKNRLSAKCARQRCQCFLGCPESLPARVLFSHREDSVALKKTVTLLKLLYGNLV